MKKKVGVFCIGMIVMVSAFLGCEKKKETTVSAYPDTLIQEEVIRTDTAYEWKRLSWYTGKEDAEKTLTGYTKETDQNDIQIYWTDGTLKDGTPVKEQVFVGYKQGDQNMELVGVQITVFMEDEEKAAQLMETWKDALNDWREQENTHVTWNKDTVQLLNQESGSYIALYEYPKISEERKEEFSNITWDTYSAVSVNLWCPEDRLAGVKNIN